MPNPRGLYSTLVLFGWKGSAFSDGFPLFLSFFLNIAASLGTWKPPARTIYILGIARREGGRIVTFCIMGFFPWSLRRIGFWFLRFPTCQHIPTRRFDGAWAGHLCAGHSVVVVY